MAELAFALGMQQSEEAAFDVVRQQLGEEEEEDIEFALALASHSLLARDLLREGAGDEYELAPPLGEVIRLVADATRSIICSRTEGDRTEELSFHFGPRGVVKRRVRSEVVHEFEISEGVEDAAAAAADFYSAPRDASGATPPVTLLESLVDETLFSRQRYLVEERISQAHAPGGAATALTDDLLGYSLRGALMMMDHLEDGTTTFEPRYALIKGPARLWIVTPLPPGGEPEIEFSLCSRGALKDAFLRIVHDSPVPARE